jgi:hypothetical protein
MTPLKMEPGLDLPETNGGAQWFSGQSRVDPAGPQRLIGIQIQLGCGAKGGRPQKTSWSSWQVPARRGDGAAQPGGHENLTRKQPGARGPHDARDCDPEISKVDAQIDSQRVTQSVRERFCNNNLTLGFSWTHHAKRHFLLPLE